MRRKALSSPASLLLVLLASLTLSVTPAAAAKQPASSFPQAGYLSSLHLAARISPSSTAPVAQVLNQFRSDELPTVVLAVSSKLSHGELWYRLSLPGRPNGRYGWVKANYLEGMTSRQRQIVVDRGARTLTLFEHGHVLFETEVAVGRLGMETPTGHFYLMAGFHPSESVLGPWAFETSAYSKLSDWPGGGIIGIHGWNDPSVFGQAVSHGCVRVSDSAILRLKSLVTPGTPVDIID